MPTNAIQIAEFHTGDEIVLAEGPHKYVRGTFVGLKSDEKWADIKEANGAISTIQSSGCAATAGHFLTRHYGNR